MDCLSSWHVFLVGELGGQLLEGEGFCSTYRFPETFGKPDILPLVVTSD